MEGEASEGLCSREGSSLLVLHGVGRGVPRDAFIPEKSVDCFQKNKFPDVLDGDWWFVLRNDSRSKHVFENNNVTMPSEEDNQGDGNED
jgi:hypothetical protein